MKFDIPHHLGAVARVVGNRERDGRPAKVVLATRTYATDVDDLWDALTDAERIPRWFLPVTGDLRPAGGTSSRATPAARSLAASRRRLSRSPGSSAATSPGSRSACAGRTGDGDHAAPRAHAPDVADPTWSGQYGPGAVGVGWDLALLGLAEHLATGEPSIDPAESRRGARRTRARPSCAAAATAGARPTSLVGDDPRGAAAAAAAHGRLLHRRRTPGLRCTPSTSSATRSGGGSSSCSPTARRARAT